MSADQPTGDVVACPASGVQQGLWFLDRLQPGQAAYNVVTALDVLGDVDWDVLHACVDALVTRHEPLRTSFGSTNGQPVQIIHATVTSPFFRVSLVGHPHAEAEAWRLATVEASTAFDLSVAPLLRVRVFSITPQRHMLVVTLHHIVCDGWSQVVLFDELGALYEARRSGQPSPLPAVQIQYADFTVWLEKRLTPQRRASQLDYWRGALRHPPDTVEWGADRPRPPVPSGRGSLEGWSIDASLTDALRRLCRTENVTMFMTFVAALQVFLYRHSGQTDLIVGAPVAARPRPEVERTIGFFANTVAIRADLSGHPTFRDVLNRVRTSALGAYEHQDVPFFEVVQAVSPERSLAHTPLFQVMCAFQRVPDTILTLPGVTISPARLGNGTAKFDLLLDVQERANDIEASFEYSTDLFDAATCRRWIGRFTVLLEAACARPHSPIGSLPILTADESRALDTWNDTLVSRDPEATVVSLFERQVVVSPMTPAVSYDGEALTFHALDARANRLAHALIARGVEPGDRVGICLERSLDLPIAVLGALKAGAAYVPLDPGYPSDRLRFMVENADVRVLLCTPRTAMSLFGAAEAPLVFSDWSTVSAACPPTAPPVDLRPEHAGYVMYTSGSTGQPKGVVMPHRALVNLVEWQRTRSAPRLKTLQYSALSFDVSFQEFFSTWASGGQLVLIPESARRDPRQLLEVVRTERVERIFLPVVALQMLAEAAIEQAAVPTSLREVITAGEQLRITPAIRRFFAALPDAHLDNQYGPTETHVVTAHMLTGNPQGWPELPPIGTPIANTRVHLLDDLAQPVPVGVAGELWISGVALADGYFRREDLTADRFRRLQVSGRDVTAYKTGDAARYRADGTIEFLGRRDDQVKIRGFRVEPGEVEAVLGTCPGVRQAIVVARPHATGLRLLAFYVPTPGTTATGARMREFLASRLPDYLVPAGFIPLTELPLTPSGKVDRRRLPVDPELEAARENVHVIPVDAIEAQLVEIWCDVLAAPVISTEDDFFEIGGHSLAAVRVLSRIEKTMDVPLLLSAFFENATITRLASVIREHRRQPNAEQAQARTEPIQRAKRRSRDEAPGVRGPAAGQGEP